MKKLEQATKYKLLVPIVYFLAANASFITIFDAEGLFHQIPGIVITDIGFTLWLIARVQLGNAFSIAPRSKFLVTSGVYSKLRHPVYYFSITTVIGISIFIWSYWMLVVIAALTLLEAIRIKQEETVLLESFGSEYAAYKQRSWF